MLVALDPADKINAAHDAQVQADIHKLATALETYAVTHNGQYVTTASHDAAQSILIASGDLKATLTPPNGYSPCASSSPAGQYYVNFDSVSNTMIADCILKSKKYTSQFATPHFIWCASSGRAGVTNGACP